MSDTLYYILCALLSVGVLIGIKWMSSVSTAVKGNRLSALCMLIAIILTLFKYEILSLSILWIGLLVGTLIGIWLTFRVKMIEMPQMVGLLNGLGGLASAIAAGLTLFLSKNNLNLFENITASLALIIGSITFSGSLVAAGKLQRLLPQKPIVLPSHQLWLMVSLVLCVVGAFFIAADVLFSFWLVIITLASLAFGVIFAIRVGGADMPITISLLNSTSGVAAAISGMAIGDLLLVAVGGIVGASGLLLTQVMCHSMNRNLISILFGTGHHAPPAALSEIKPGSVSESATELLDGKEASSNSSHNEQPVAASPENPFEAAAQWLQEAQDIIIIPGYGMAVSQAQEEVKRMMDLFIHQGKKTRFAIHPVAGRMPGHMNVLLAEVDIPYDQLHEMDEINPDFDSTDVAFIIGANDVVNPAANTAVDTPIYGMPVLNADKAKKLVICNFDLKPGYAGVPNPLYDANENIALLLGDAKETLTRLLQTLY